MKKIFNIFIFLFIFILFQCSSEPQVQRKIGIKINSGIENIYDVPVTATFQLGDTVTFRAIINSPYVFDKWAGDFSGTDNPRIHIVTMPRSFSFDYTTSVAYTMKIVNSEFIDSKNFEFDVNISANSGSFMMTAYQCIFNTGTGITGTLSFIYIANSSELINVPAAGIGVTNGELTFATASALSETITTVVKKVGRFRLTSTNNFLFNMMGIIWDFDLPINTIITGENVSDITQYGTFNNLSEKHKVKFLIN